MYIIHLVIFLAPVEAFNVAALTHTRQNISLHSFYYSYASEKKNRAGQLTKIKHPYKNGNSIIISIKRKLIEVILMIPMLDLCNVS